jgi:hypothetical protein
MKNQLGPSNILERIEDLDLIKSLNPISKSDPDFMNCIGCLLNVWRFICQLNRMIKNLKDEIQVSERLQACLLLIFEGWENLKRGSLNTQDVNKIHRQSWKSWEITEGYGQSRRLLNIVDIRNQSTGPILTMFLIGYFLWIFFFNYLYVISVCIAYFIANICIHVLPLPLVSGIIFSSSLLCCGVPVWCSENFYNRLMFIRFYIFL